MDEPEYDEENFRDEFLAEANEIVEALSRDLLLLDESKVSDPGLLNEIFRGVHTLKGMAGMFGFDDIGKIAHALEDLLDDLRLGRVDMGQAVIDVLFQGVESFQRLLAGGEEAKLDVDAYARAVVQVASPPEEPDVRPEGYDIDEATLKVLTEYEEHRLRANVENGVPLYRIYASFPLATIDVSLEAMKAKAKILGEVITYLPTLGEEDGNTIYLEILVASNAPMDRLKEELCDGNARIEQIGFSRPNAPLSEKKRVSVAPSPPKMGSIRPPADPDDDEDMVGGRPGSGPPDANAIVHEDVVSMRSVGRSVRVDIRKLDHLMNVVGELGLAKGGLDRIADRIRAHPDLRALALDLQRINRVFERYVRDLQNGILGVRMVPLRQLFDRLARGVRQASREHGKEVRFVVTGADTEVDKLIIEELADPFMHMIRNCVDHGIEPPDSRLALMKRREGMLALNAYQKGSHVVIDVEDDGAGIDPELIGKRAIERGMISADELKELTREEQLALVFLPGFTTRTVATETSGRGFGMDIVKTNIGRLGGVIDVYSEVGIGTTFTITLPITLAIVRSLVVRVGDRKFTIPLTSVREAIQVDASVIRVIDGREAITHREGTLPICRLDRFFSFGYPSSAKRYFVVIIVAGNRQLGCLVDDLLGQRDVVIKSLGKSLEQVRGFAGAAELEAGELALVLDPPGLVEEVLASSDARMLARAAV